MFRESSGSLNAWVVFMVAAGNTAALALVVVPNWSEFEAPLAKDPVAWLSLLIPLLSFVAALLLVCMSRWAVLVLSLHLIIGFGYIVLRGDVRHMSAETLLSFGVKGLVLLWCIHLWRSHKLR